MAQWVKDLALSLQWLGPLLWCGFNPWPRNFHMPWAWPKKKKKKFEQTQWLRIMSPDQLQLLGSYVPHDFPSSQMINEVTDTFSRPLSFPSSNQTWIWCPLG